MSNVFAGKTGVKGGNVEEDYLGGGGVLDTDIYPAKIKTAYLQKAKSSDAMSLNLILTVGKTEVREQIWMTNRAGDVTYDVKKDGKPTGEKQNLPGFNTVTSLCMLVCGVGTPGEMEVEERSVNIYDYDAKKEVPQSVDCFVELHDQDIQVALQRVTVDKTKKNDNTGDYEPTGETRDQNEIVKFFPEDARVTIREVQNFIEGLGANFDETIEEGNLLKAIGKMGDTTGDYAQKWLDKNRGETYDKSKGKAKGGGKEFGGGSKSSESGESKAKAKSALFDD